MACSEAKDCSLGVSWEQHDWVLNVVDILPLFPVRSAFVSDNKKNLIKATRKTEQPKDNYHYLESTEPVILFRLRT